MKRIFLPILSALSLSAALLFSGCNLNSGTPVIYNDIVWVVGNNTDESGTILKTTDSGLHWTRQGTTEIPDVFLSDVLALNADTAWVVGENIDGSGTIFKTTDGGEHWTRQGSGEVPDQPLYCITALSTQIAWAVGGNGTIVKTINGGANWTDQSYATVAQLMGVKAVNEDLVWAAGDKDGGYPVILKTTNGGANWVRKGSGSVEVSDNAVIKITAIGLSKVWAVGAKRNALRSINGGISWTEQFDAHPPSSGDINNIVALNDNKAWAAADAGVMISTITGGLTWDISNTGTGGYYMLGLDAVSEKRIWSAGSNYWPIAGNIIFTDNGGSSWTKQLDWSEGLCGVSAVGGYR